MTRDEKNAYARGYNTGQTRGWPAHRPPLPPESPLVVALMKALTELCDSADAEFATFEPGDEMAERVLAKVDAARAAMGDITEYLNRTGE